MSVVFWFLAGLLTGVTAACVAIPLWRVPGRLIARHPYAYAAAGGGIAIFAVAAAILYVGIGSRHSMESSSGANPAAHPGATQPASDAPVPSMQAATTRLQERLSREGGSAADWLLLAQSYDFLGRPDDAQRARLQAAGAPKSPPATAPASAVNSAEAAALLGAADGQRKKRDFGAARTAYEKVIALNGMTSQSWADYADVLGSLAGGTLTTEAGTAVDRALALDPANAKALWLKASRALQQRQYADALTIWKRLKGALAPDSPDVPLVDANIAEATRLAAASPGQSLDSLPVQLLSTTATTEPTAEISGTVAIEERLASRVQKNSTLFIYARAVDSPGPPLAVVRTTAGTWPVSFRLDDSMAMLPSRRLSQFRKVVIEARISHSGRAEPAPGDLYVTSEALSPGTGQKLALIINREIG